MKKTMSLLLAFSLALALMSFAGAEEALPSVAVVVAGGLGDRSFYDSASGGLELLKAEGVKGTVIECKNDASLFEQSLIAAAESFDFVVAVGWEFWEPLETVAPELPDTKFIFVDNELTGIDNIYAITYAENEGSFLVGYIAAKLSETGVIGAVGGEDNTTINNFMVGYKQGAAYANPDIRVEISYTADYEDPAKGKEHALALYDKGADVIFQVAGKTGEGVFEAAKEKGKYAIGVDSDQKYIAPDVIVCSMIKEVGLSVYDAVTRYVEDGSFPGGTVWNANMKSGLISVGFGDETMPQQVSQALIAEVKALTEMIVSGEIVVETTR
ncbi:MAG: BMP family ABC transporter substrate-binding protein [Firmicutes bacterium]|nr:BMP family ABC transporter substrate-binding protein [Bacillota bacterium]